MTLAEEDPAYAAKVQAYLDRNGQRRLPYGAIVAHGSITQTTSTRERARRAEVAEVALALSLGLGVTMEQLEAMADRLPWNAAPDQHVAILQELREAPAEEFVAQAAPAAEPQHAASESPPVT